MIPNVSVAGVGVPEDACLSRLQASGKHFLMVPPSKAFELGLVPPRNQ